MDPLGNRTSTTFDAASRTIASINPLGLRTSTNYDSVGRAIASIDPLGRRTTTTYDVAGRTITSIDPLGNRTSTTFDAASRTIASINPLGFRTSTTYDAVGRAIASIDPLANRTSTTFDAAGRAIASIDPLGNRTSTTRDAAGRSIATINPLGLRTSTNYDAVGRAIASIDPLGKRTSTTFDAAGRSIARIDPLGNRTSTSFDAVGRTVATVNPLGFRTSTNYDAVGRAIASVDPFGKRTTTTFDAAGRAIASIDPLGNRTSTTFDAAGRTVATINALGQRTSMGYDNAGRQINQTEARGNRSTTVFDAAGRAVGSIDPLGGRLTNTFDAAGRQTRVQNALGFLTTTTYLATGAVQATIDPLGGRITSAYDAAGRQRRTQNALGFITTTTFDAAGRSVASIDPLLRRVSTTYDAASRPIARIDGNGNRTSTIYDVAGRSVATVNALGYRITSVYDAASQRTGLIDSNGNRVTFLFDAAGRDAGSIDPLLRRVTMGYDAAGNRLFKLDPRGIRVTAVYDPLNRPTAEQYSTGKRNTYGYDPVGNRTRLLDSTGLYTATFDAKSRTTVVTNPNAKRVSYSYDLADNRTRLIDPDGGRFTNSFDAKNRQTRVLNPQGKRTSLGYDAADQLIQQIHGNASRTTQMWDGAGQMIGLSNSGAPGVIVNRFTNTYDQARNRTQVVESSGDRTSWTYDPSYQLKREYRTGVTSFVVTYGYDRAGNRLTATDSGTRTTSTFDSANQLLTDTIPTGRTTYAYDQCGNRIQKNAPAALTNYKWDENNRMLAAFPVTNPVTLAYNADGRRVQKATATTTTNFVFDFEKVLQESNAGLMTTNEYTSTTDQYGNLLSAYANNSTSYYESDALGSTDALVNDLQIATDRWVYRAFGLDNHTLGATSNSRTFVGRQGYIRDLETDLYFIDARYYDYAAGRWISEDPIGYRDDIHLYRYVRNNPVNAVDPSGKALFLPAFRASFATIQEALNRANRGLPITSQKIESRSTDRLTRYFQDAFDLKKETVSFWGTIALANGPAFKLDLLGSLPGTVWKKLLDYSEREGGCDDSLLLRADPSVLARGASLVTRCDFLLDLQTTESCPQGEAAPQIRTSLYLKPLHRPSIFGRLGQLLGQVGQFFANLLSAGLSVLKNLGRIALTVVLRAAGVSPDQIDRFFDGLQQIGETLVGDVGPALLEVGREIISDPWRFAQRFIDGGKRGFERFVDSLWENVRDAVVRWLFGDTNPPLPMNLSVDRLILYGLGINPVALEQRARQLGLATATIQKLREANIDTLLAQYNQSVPSWLMLSQDNIVRLFANAARRFLETEFLPKLPQAVFERLFPVLGGARSIVGSVVWAVTELAGLLRALARGLREAASGTQDRVERAVIMALRDLAPALLRLFARLLGLERLKDQFIQSVRARLRWLLDRILQWFGLRATSLIGPRASRSGRVTGWVQETGTGVTVMMQTNPTLPVSDFLRGCVEVRGRNQTRVQEATRLTLSLRGLGVRLRSLPVGARDTSQGDMQLARLVELLDQLRCACLTRRAGSCFVAGSLVWRKDGKLVPIEDVEDDNWLWTLDQKEQPVASLVGEAGQPRKRIRLRQTCDDSCVDVLLVRSDDWVLRNGVRVGARVCLDMPEMGVQGSLEVLSVESRPPALAGRFGLVTGLFRHNLGPVYDLVVDGETKPIGVTGLHPFWSADRMDWVDAKQLRVGERLQGLGGKTPHVVSLTLRPKPEAVFNIEVEGDHCYRVGDQGLLVHNISQSDSRRDPNRASNPCGVPSTAFCQAHHVIPCETWDEPAATRIHECCFDLNGPDNLIMLPCCEYEGRKAAYHTGRTPSGYVRDVRALLQQLDRETDPARFCAGAMTILQNLKNGLCNNPMYLNRTTNIPNCSGARPSTCSVPCS
jgi:RHS repeat-associated protein